MDPLKSFEDVFPIENEHIPASYVSLPEGILLISVFKYDVAQPCWVVVHERIAPWIDSHGLPKLLHRVWFHRWNFSRFCWAQCVAWNGRNGIPKKNLAASFFFHQKSLLRAGVNLSTTGNVHIFTSSWGDGDSSGNPGMAVGGWWSFTTQSSTAFEFVAAIHLAHLACPTRDSPGEEENAHPGMSTWRFHVPSCNKNRRCLYHSIQKFWMKVWELQSSKPTKGWRPQEPNLARNGWIGTCFNEMMAWSMKSDVFLCI